MADGEAPAGPGSSRATAFQASQNRAGAAGVPDHWRDRPPRDLLGLAVEPNINLDDAWCVDIIGLLEI